MIDLSLNLAHMDGSRWIVQIRPGGGPRLDLNHLPTAVGRIRGEVVGSDVGWT